MTIMDCSIAELECETEHNENSVSFNKRFYIEYDELLSVEVIVCCVQLLDMLVSDYQPIMDDLMSTARDLSQVCVNDNVQLSVSDVIDKFTSVKETVHQHRESLDLMPCVSSQDVSHSL